MNLDEGRRGKVVPLIPLSRFMLRLLQFLQSVSSRPNSSMESSTDVRYTIDA